VEWAQQTAEVGFRNDDNRSARRSEGRNGGRGEEGHDPGGRCRFDAGEPGGSVAWVTQREEGGGLGVLDRGAAVRIGGQDSRQDDYCMRTSINGGT
jgi:hypothetical protein